MKQRLQNELKTIAIVLVIGLLYLIFVLVTDIKIPCIIKLATGFDCPSCGITRMFVSMAKFDFAAAFRYNPVIFSTLPLLIFILTVPSINYIKSNNRGGGIIYKISVISEISILVIYGIARNIL